MCLFQQGRSKYQALTAHLMHFAAIAILDVKNGEIQLPGLGLFEVIIMEDLE